MYLCGSALSPCAAWSPAPPPPATSGTTGWEFDFLAVVQISQVKVGSSVNIGGEQFRPPTRVMVQMSGAPGMGFVDVQEIAPGATVHTLASAMVTRYVRLVILEVGDEANQDALPIGISGVQFHGCGYNGIPAPDVSSDCAAADFMPTPESDDVAGLPALRRGRRERRRVLLRRGGVLLRAGRQGPTQVLRKQQGGGKRIRMER